MRREEDKFPLKPDTVPIRLEDIDALLSYLPLFEDPGRTFVKSWAGGEKNASGTFTMPYPIYEDDVLSFIRLAGQPTWSDYSYYPAKARKMLEDDTIIANCSLADFKTMLTYCVRGERFCDGHWEGLLKSGRIVVLLKRLKEMRNVWI